MADDSSPHPARSRLARTRSSGGSRSLSPSRPQRELRDRRRPLLLLPVRLETRFSGDDLKIRIYPDQIHLDDHAPRLTDREAGSASPTGTAASRRSDPARDELVRRAARRGARSGSRGETRPTVGPKGGAGPPRASHADGDPPATAALMPDRWCALGFVGNMRAFVAFGTRSDAAALSPDLEGAGPVRRERRGATGRRRTGLDGRLRARARRGHGDHGRRLGRRSRRGRADAASWPACARR